MRMHLRIVIYFGLISVASPGVHAQERIPEQLAREGRSLMSSVGPPSGYTSSDRSIKVLLEVTDVIVRGRLEKPRSYLSDDEREVHTEYAIADPEYLYMATLSKPDLPDATSVALRGGEVTINSLMYTANYEALPLPPAGTDCLLLLRYFGKRYYIAGAFYGIFRITAGRLEPLSNDGRYVEEYRNALVSKGIQEIVARRMQLGQ